MKNYQRDLIVSWGEYLPQLLLLITDILLLAGAGDKDQVAGASVAGILLGAIARLSRALFSTNCKLAERFSRKRVLLVSTTYYWSLLAIALACVVWAAAVPLESFVRLKGMSGYLLWGCPAFALWAIAEPAKRALKINLKRQVARVWLAWAMAVTNILITYILVNMYGMGAEGASLGTLLSGIIPTAVVVSWAHGDKVLAWPTTKYLRFVYSRARKKTRAQVPALVGSVAALFLNRWLGPELATEWTYAHTACDVVGGLVCVGWDAGSRHYTLNLVSNRPLAEEAWRWVDKIVLGIVVVGTFVSIWVCPVAPIVVLAYCAAKRFDFLVEREGRRKGFDRQGDGKLAYTTCCIVGYGLLVVYAQPDVWSATAVYACGMTAQIMVLRKP